MWKVLCIGILLVQLVAGAKIGKVIGPIGDEAESIPLFGSYYTNKYAKIARKIVHDASEWFLSEPKHISEFD